VPLFVKAGCRLRGRMLRANGLNMDLAEQLTRVPETIQRQAAFPLSIFIITCNEADRIGTTIRAVRALSDDIVVVDSGSTDETREIAASLGARVIENAWPGYGPQKRFAEEQCRHPWLLNIDADEVLPPELSAEIAVLFAGGSPEKDAYKIRIAEIFPGEGAPKWWSYALEPVRLYRHAKGRYADSTVHDRVKLHGDASVGKLKGTIHHFSVRSLGDQIDKLNRYSDAQVDDLLAKRAKKAAKGAFYAWLSDLGYNIRVFVEFPATFVKGYIFRRQALRGVYGFLTSMNFAFYRYQRIAKYLERLRLLRRGLSPQRPFASAEQSKPKG
jgi:glycosyltransferase involved in cell wall biosynthesis